MLPAYVVHSMEGRARLRHHALLDNATCTQAKTLLAEAPEVREVQPGYGSLLLFLQPDADMAALCARLEDALPALRCAAHAEKKPSSRRCSPRRWEVRLLALVSLLCLASAFYGSGKLHMYVGLALTGLMTRHAWQRRAAL